MKRETPNEQLVELVRQALEHEIGATGIYGAALKCALRAELKEEWEKSIHATARHVEFLIDLCAVLDIDTARDTPGVLAARRIRRALVEAMELGLQSGTAEAAQLIACECVVLAATKDRLDWDLIGKYAGKLLKGDGARMLREACQRIRHAKDEQLYHAEEWYRGIWIESLGMKAVLPVASRLGATLLEPAGAPMGAARPSA